MLKIFKYELQTVAREGTATIEMPQDAKVLHVAARTGPTRGVFMWAIVDTELPVVPTEFFVLCTGEPLPDTSVKYINTFFMDMPPLYLVYHLFQKLTVDEIQIAEQIAGPPPPQRFA